MIAMYRKDRYRNVEIRVLVVDGRKSEEITIEPSSSSEMIED